MHRLSAVRLNDLLLYVSVNVPQLQFPEHCLCDNALQLWMLLLESDEHVRIVHQLKGSGVGLFHNSVCKEI